MSLHSERGARGVARSKGGNMAVRHIRCKCNYKLRFGATSCPYCFKPTVPWNRYVFWIALLLILFVGIAIFLQRGV